MGWRIDIPHRGDPDQDLVEAMADCREGIEDGEQRHVTRQLLLDYDTIGEVIDALGAATPEQRRDLLDGARERVGLPTTAQADFDREFAALQPPRRGRQRNEAGEVIGPVCAEQDCVTQLLDPATGGPGRSRAKAWRCEVHRDGHEADMQDWAPRLGYNEVGLVVDLDEREIEIAHARLREEKLASERKRRQEESAAAAAEYAESEAAKREQYERELPDPLFNTPS
jgi:hypothetical protein